MRLKNACKKLQINKMAMLDERVKNIKQIAIWGLVPMQGRTLNNLTSTIGTGFKDYNNPSNPDSKLKFSKTEAELPPIQHVIKVRFTINPNLY